MVDHILQSRYMKNKDQPNKFWNYKKIDNSHRFHQNIHDSCQFPTDTISFQTSQKIKAGDDISLSVTQ